MNESYEMWQLSSFRGVDIVGRDRVLCVFYERFGDSLCRIFRFFVGEEERVHFGAESDDFQSRNAV